MFYRTQSRQVAKSVNLGRNRTLQRVLYRTLGKK